MATGSSTCNLSVLLFAAGAALATAAGPAAGQYTGLYADFDLDYIHTLPPGATEFDASGQLVYPEWWIELENASDSVIPIDGVEFVAPYPFTYTFPDWDEANGYTYTFPGKYLLPSERYTIRAEQDTEGEQIHIPFTVSREITGSEITGEGDVTITFSVTPEEGLDDLEFALAVLPSETREDWEHEIYFGTVSHVSAYPYDSSLNHIDTEYGQIYVWSYDDYTPGQEYTFQCTVTVTLDDPYDHVFIEPLAQAAAHRLADYGTEVWTDNMLDVPAPHTGTVELVSGTAVSDDNPSHYIPWVGVEMPHYVEAYSDTDIFHVDGIEFTKIQDAIDAAVGPALILVDPGTYNEMINFSGRQVVVRSLGGPQVTTIDAQGAGPVVKATSGEGPDVVLDGFTITGGLADHWGRGGGAYLYESAPTFIDCIFTGNSALKWWDEDDWEWYPGRGGAIYMECDDVAYDILISGCSFVANSAEGYGGAVYVDSYEGGSISIHNCVFSGNTAGSGGAGYIYGGSAVTAITISECTFTGNTSSEIAEVDCDGDGGALSLSADDATVLVSDCVFDSNMAEGRGGGAYLRTPAAILASTFTSNYADQSGGAVCYDWYYGQPGDVTECTFTSNTAGGGGGAISYHDCDGSGNVVRCAFSFNSSGCSGGAIGGSWSDSGETEIADCTFTSNAAIGSGGAIAEADDVTNCEFVLNYATWSGGAVVGADAVSGCTFDSNTAEAGSGGAIASVDSIAHCTFNSNSAGDSGGAAAWINSADGCDFTSNIAGGDGGGATLYGQGMAISDCSFSGNTAGGDGGAMCTMAWTGVITNSPCTDNHAASGGAISATGNGDVALVNSPLNLNTAATTGGAIDVKCGDFTATGCDITENTAAWGGGILCGTDDAVCTLNLTDCTVANNDAWYGGGALIAGWDIATFTNCLFGQNTAYFGAGIRVSYGFAVVDTCDFEQNTATYGGGGISNLEGYLAVGDSWFCENAPDHIEGIYEDNGGNEFADTCASDCPADVNGDEFVDIDDLFAVLAAWGSCSNCPEDINDDELVNIDDVFAVLAAWGPCP